MYERTAQTRARVLARHAVDNHQETDDYNLSHAVSKLPGSNYEYKVDFFWVQNHPPFRTVKKTSFDGKSWTEEVFPIEGEKNVAEESNAVS